MNTHTKQVNISCIFRESSLFSSAVWLRFNFHICVKNAEYVWPDVEFPLEVKRSQYVAVFSIVESNKSVNEYFKMTHQHIEFQNSGYVDRPFLDACTFCVSSRRSTSSDSCIGVLIRQKSISSVVTDGINSLKFAICTSDRHPRITKFVYSNRWVDLLSFSSVVGFWSSLILLQSLHSFYQQL